ncbi:Aquaporin-7, partial [Termitomyces sp. T112]
MEAPVVHLRDIQTRSKIFTIWEKQRNKKEVHWFMEMFAETLGVFFYVYAGLSSVTGFVVGNILKQPLSSMMQIGLAYSFGILFAIGVCGATSGGHFNPCITISFVVFRGFPPSKAARYIFAQIVGAYLACLVIYTEWKVLLVDCEAILEQAGQLDALQFTPNGPAGIFGLYLLPGQTLPRVFLNEFVTDTLIGLVLFAAIDPTNALVPPVMASVLVALA